MDKFWRIIFSRTFFLITLFLFQIAIVLSVTAQIASVNVPFYSTVTILFVCISLILFEKHNLQPAYQIMWLIIILVVPISGFIYFLLFGRRHFTHKSSKFLNELERRAAATILPDSNAIKQLVEQDCSSRKNAEYLATNAAAPVFTGTKASYFATGEIFFKTFLQYLKKAEKFIFMEYFIINDDSKMWLQTLNILIEKAAAGIDVRILYDNFGCIATLPDDYPDILKAYGIKCYSVNALHFTFDVAQYKMFNHRDHRKITVIDGEVGFAGGLNFADEYINEITRFGYWKDTAFCLEGAAVYKLTCLFLTMWDFTTNEKTNYLNYKNSTFFPTTGWVQPFGDSPLDDENVTENAYINLIQRARNYVYIVTPYLIIDNKMFAILCLAAKSGVDVRIVTPSIPDKMFAFHVTQSYYAGLLKAGVRIYEYTPGFIHAKMLLSDDDIAIVGSANLDYRSLYLHFENCCVFYHSNFVSDVKDDIKNILRNSKEITLDDTNKTPVWRRFARAIYRIFAPLM